MLTVVLTLFGILAVIWWLTGASRRDQRTVHEEIDADVAEEAVKRIGPGGIVAGSGGREPVGRILYELFVRLGMDAYVAMSTVRGMGCPVTEKAKKDPTQLGLRVINLREEQSRSALVRALLVGVQLARMNDDYAGVSDEVITFDALKEKADEVEATLFDDSRRRLMDFYSRAVLVLQDQGQSEQDPDERRVIGEILERFDDELETLQEELTESMASLPADTDSIGWGGSEDRRRYYFKMGVTNSLRQSGHLDSLGHLYRFRGVNYDVEEAFQLAGEEEPVLLHAAGLEFSTLVALGPPDVRRMTQECSRPRAFPKAES